MNTADYYGDPAVRARILEFCGAGPDSPATAAYVAVFDPKAHPFPTWDEADRVTADAIPWSVGHDLSCSLWDTTRLLFFIEIDHQNVDHPDEPFRHPADVLVALEPTYHAVRAALASVGLPARAFVSGRGYHFLGALQLDDPVVDALARLVPGTPGWWAGWESRRPAGVTATLEERHARAADGLGLLIEYLAHLSLREARRASPTPVVFNGTTVGSGLNGRAAISIDFSHVGDPLDVRHVRTAFSTYQWHRLRPDIFGEAVRDLVAPMAIVPRAADGLVSLLAGGRTLEAAAAVAPTTTGALPDVAAGVGRLLARYTRSPLARFHERYLAALAAPDEAGLEAGGPARLPACAARPLEAPDDLLLQPAVIQHVTRVLYAQGWHAAAIARLIARRYEADHEWGDRWTRLDAPTRAAFDVRVFAGMIETGLDTLVDFNCVSTQEKDLCPRIDCPLNLERERDRLRARWRA
ncbi:MAG TPA: hypothetical protein VMM93_14965 [Vicinamibacterales bacterium]|nr:hypothetical protein [Vicinamibacterales bacterium]